MPALPFNRQLNSIQAGCGKKAPVGLGILLAQRTPLIEIGQFHGNNGGLECVKAEIPADQLVIVFRLRSVHPENFQLFT